MQTITKVFEVFEFDELDEAGKNRAIVDWVNFLLEAYSYEAHSPEIQKALDKAEQMQTPWFAGEYVLDYAKEEVLDNCRSVLYLANGNIFSEKEN